MIQVLINGVDYSRYVETQGDATTLQINDQLNQPAKCQFTLVNIDEAFVIPAREAYVQIFSTQYNVYHFTGFISSAIERDFVGLYPKSRNLSFQMYRFLIKCTGDEYLLGAKALPPLPPLVNMGAGQILAILANQLAPNFFNTTSQCLSGDIVPYFPYDPTKSWVDISKQFADQFRYRVRILNKVLYYQPWGDQPLPIRYDETLNQKTFDPFNLQTTIYDTPLVNDALVYGDIEAGDNHEDFFVGDGLTGTFPLRYTAFEADTAKLLETDWTSTTLDQQTWALFDPTNAVNLAGALNVNGGPNQYGGSYMYLQSGIDCGRKTFLQAGELFVIGACSGCIIGAVYDNAGTQFTSGGIATNAFSEKSNWLLQSENFSLSGIWLPFGLTGSYATPNNVIAPNGTLTATSLTGLVGPNCGIQQRMPLGLMVGQVITFAVWLKVPSGTLNNFFIGLLDFANGNTIVSQTLCNLTTSWQRFTVTGILASNGQVETVIGGLGSWSNGQVIHAWGAQVSIDGQFPSSYVLTTTAPVLSACCEAGFDIRNGFNLSIATSVSGTSGVQIQPRRLGQFVGPSVITQQNHYYVLSLLINADSHNRYTNTFKSLTGAIITGGTNTASGDITWTILDINLNNTNPNQPGFVPLQLPNQTTRFTLRNQTLPAFAIYTLVNDLNSNLTVSWTTIADPPQASLSVAGLTGASGMQLPLLPQNIGGYIDYAPGFGIGTQVGTIGSDTTSGTSSTGGSSDGRGSSLDFYSDSIPGVGSRIRIQAWEAQTAVARVQDPTNIAAIAASVGDDGHRSNIFSDFKPIPRSSEECELAAKAVLIDREGTIYQGSYGPIREVFFSFSGSDFPRTGRFLTINSPQRSLNNYIVNVSQVQVNYLELFSEQMNIQMNFGPTLFLQNLLQLFVQKPTDVLLPKDSASQPTPIQLSNVTQAYCADLDTLTLTGGQASGFIWGFNGSNIYVDVGFNVPVTGSFIEARRTNFGWGQNNNDRLGIFQTRSFTLPRLQYDQIWYFRQLQGTLSAGGTLLSGGLFSRRSKVIRVYAPLVPAAPLLMYADTTQIQCNFNGDLRNMYGIELRASDNSTILAQNVIGSFSDLYFPLQALPATQQLFNGKNLLLWTDEFSNSVWTKETNSAVTVTENSVNSPLGNLTADTVTKGNGNARTSQAFSIQQSIQGNATQPYIYSIWLRVASGTLNVSIGFTDNAVVAAGINVTLTTQWQRFSVTTGIAPFTNSGSLGVGVAIPDSSPGGTALFAWGAQLEQAFVSSPNIQANGISTSTLSPLPFNPNPSSYFANDGAITPRQRITYPEQFDNPVWSIIGNASVSANCAFDPFGIAQTADLLIGGTAPNQIRQVISADGTIPYTFSIWMKSFSGSVAVAFGFTDVTVHTGSISVTATPQWQKFSVNTIQCATTNTGSLAPVIAIPSNKSIFLWGAQLEAGEQITPYIGGLGLSTRPFYAYFFNLMWEYSPTPLLLSLSSPIAPILTLGNKLSNDVEARLSQIARTDIKYTVYQISTDSSFATNVISVTGSSQPEMMKVTVANSAGLAFVARAKRTDFIGDGPWSATLNIPYGTLISSNWSIGQGSIPPTLDNQATALFSATTTANAPGGANTGEIVISWPNFTIVYADGTTQSVSTNSFDTGVTLTTSTSTTTTYIFYPRIQANIAGALPQFVNGAHATQSPTDAAACVADGFVALAGAALSISFTIPAAPNSGPPNGGSGSGGGSQCIPRGEKLNTPKGEINIEEAKLGMLVECEESISGERHSSRVEAISYGEEECVKITLEDDHSYKCSTRTHNPVWVNTSESVKQLEHLLPSEMTIDMYMKAKEPNELIRVKSIEFIGMTEVVRVTLSPYHEMFVNGVLGHNTEPDK